MDRIHSALAAILAGLLLGGCTANEAIVASIASDARPEADIANDAGRKPEETLRFFAIQQGDDVLDVFGGCGYYTELVSRIVGLNGSVALYNNAAWDRFVGAQVAERLAGDRLSNVEYLVGKHGTLPRARYDAAIFVLGMHDLYYEDPDNGWVGIDRRAFLKSVFDSLKPGGTLGIVDRNAAPGSGASAARTLHRIEPALLTADLEAAGFALDATSGHLRNSEDDYSRTVFDPALRWKSDRSVMRFRKPL